MSLIWLLEKPNSKKQIAQRIQGSVALRLVASERSFGMLVKITPNNQLPNIILVNACDFRYSDLSFVKSKIPTAKLVKVYDDSQDSLVVNPGEVSASSLPFVIRTILEESESSQGLAIDFETMTLSMPAYNCEVPISQKEAKIIKVFLASKESVVSRETLLESAWSGMKVSRSTVDSHISRLRKKLEYVPLEIESVYGGGYKLRQGVEI